MAISCKGQHLREEGVGRPLGEQLAVESLGARAHTHTPTETTPPTTTHTHAHDEKDTHTRTRGTCVLAFTRYCHYQYPMVYDIQRGGFRGEACIA